MNTECMEDSHQDHNLVYNQFGASAVHMSQSACISELNQWPVVCVTAFMALRSTPGEGMIYFFLLSSCIKHFEQPKLPTFSGKFHFFRLRNISFLELHRTRQNLTEETRENPRRNRVRKCKNQLESLESLGNRRIIRGITWNQRIIMNQANLGISVNYSEIRESRR